MNNESKKNKVVVYLSSEGYKLSSYYGKIISDAVFSSLNAAKQACVDAGYDFIVA